MNFFRMMFLAVIVIVAFGAMFMMATMTETEVDQVARPHDVHVSTFHLTGTPSGKVALYIDGHFKAPLETYMKTTLPLTVSERCGLSIWVQNEKGVWENKYNFPCLEKGQFVKIDVVDMDVLVR
jgi:hypothetical protein